MSNWQYYSIGSDIGFVPNRPQIIIWTNCGLDLRNISASLGLSELIFFSSNAFLTSHIFSFAWARLFSDFRHLISVLNV